MHRHFVPEIVSGFENVELRCPLHAQDFENHVFTIEKIIIRL